MTNTLESRDVGALDGIVIADFSRVLAGPYATMLLADLGATVIKVESSSGDETRSWTPPSIDGKATYYLSVNRNKQSIVLDFTDPDDLATARSIVERADVLVENFKPGGLEKYGLGYEDMRTCNPRLIYASITGFGTLGGANLPGYDLLVQASSGLMSLTGSADGPPMRAGVAVVDVMTGLHTAIGILAALHRRDVAGIGQRIETNLMSSALSGLVNQSAAYALTGQVPHRMGNEHPSIYPYEPIPTGDGNLIVAIGNDRQFGALCRVLDLDELVSDERFSTVSGRNSHREVLRPLLRNALARASADQWFTVLTDAGVPCAPINDVGQGVRLGEALGLNPVIRAGADGASSPGIANPIRFSESSVSYRLAPPELDQDNASIRRWLEEIRPRTADAAAIDPRVVELPVDS